MMMNQAKWKEKAGKLSGDGDMLGVYKVAPSEVNPKEVDSFLAQEMNQLTVQEREREFHKLHGIHSADEDEDDRMQEALLQIQIEIDQISDKPAYNEALRLGSTYVFDTKFRKRFLWAEDLDAHKAAIRMINFLQYSSEVYGPSVLLRRIQFSDLGPSAVAYFKAGSGLVLPARDSSGRRIYCVAKDCISTIDRMQTDFFFWQEILDDEEDQRRGLVLVLCIFNLVQNANDPVESDMIVRLMRSVPGRFTAMHLLLPDRPLYHCIRASYVLLLGKRSRFKMRFHIGSITEILYSLKTFGIPVEFLPQNLKRDCKQALKRHVKWVDLLEAKDEARMNGYDFDKSPVIDCPIRKDILLGKGRQIMKHPGNLEMRYLLEENIHLWESATNQQKANLAREVVREIRASGGRFIREDESGWFAEVDEDTARQKVSIGFRDTVTRKKRSVSVSTSQSSETEAYATISENFQRIEPKKPGSRAVKLLDSDTFYFSCMSAESFPKRRRLSDSNADCFGFCGHQE